MHHVMASGRPAGAGLPPFQRLLDDHAGAVLRVLVVLVGPNDAEDAWQETFVKAWTAYPDLGHTDNLRGWLLTIARRTAIDHLRAVQRRPAVLMDEVADRAATTSPTIADPEGYDPQLWARVDALPSKQRLAVIYRFVADLPFADIAVLLDCSVDAARRSAHEGIRRLREEGFDDG
jgi:RNA polymerase sigma factor (sigma-70 family)